MMIFAQAMSGEELMITGAMVILTAFLLRRSLSRIQSRKDTDPIADVQAAMSKEEGSPANQIRKLELRLYEFERQLAARWDTRIEVLSQLLDRADATIARLRVVNGESAPLADSGEQTDSPAELIRLLHESGYAAQEVAHIAGVPLNEVQEVCKSDADRKAA